MEQFLSTCAAYIFKKHSSELHNICLVFPNRRAGIFFNAYMQKQISSPVIGAEITTIDELIAGFSNLQEGEKLRLISLLYDIFREHSSSNESFDDFYFWGEALLNDFNEIDRYLINAKDLFTNLADLKGIEDLFDYLTAEQKSAIEQFWGSLYRTDEKPHHQKFISIWKILYPVYTDFKKLLSKNETAYKGMIARQVIESMKDKLPEFEFQKYYFIGLNALNSCEKAFFTMLKQQQKAIFLWDYDLSYLEDLKNEAGRFIRENLKEFPPPEDFILDTTSFSTAENIRLTAVSSNYGQAQEIPRFLEEIKSHIRDEFDNTAVVLADESLLYPALGAVPDFFETVNVTMGYPVKNSVVYGFLLLLINLLKNRKKVAKGNFTSYHRYVTDLLAHQLLRNAESEKTENFLAEVKQKNRITIPLESVRFSGLHSLIFSTPEKVEDYGSWFLEILAYLYKDIQETSTDNQLLAEIIYTIYKSVEKLDTVISEVVSSQNRTISDKVFFRLFGQYIGSVSVPFEGEPLSGIQVMGILETRCLDFKNLIILGLNENKWPKALISPSFIPYNLRKGFGLPGIEGQDAIYAYHFYRLIQRAQNITATYSTIKEGIGTGELSRYGFQLLYDSKLKTKKSGLDFRFSNEPAEPIIIEGSPEKRALLLERVNNKHPLSPTAINTWLQCSLRFYFRYILQLPEPEEMKDEIDGAVFGRIFHDVIEFLYAPFVGKTITRTDLENIAKDRQLIENAIYKAIARHLLKQEIEFGSKIKPEGKTILFFENTKTFIQGLLEIDKDIAPFQLISLEKDYTFKLNVNINDKQIPVNVGGKIDRIDRTEDTLRIIDYKTGNVYSKSFNEYEELFERDKKNPKKEVLQALIYCHTYLNNTEYSGTIKPGIYSLKDFFKAPFDPYIKYRREDLIYDENEEEFPEKLQGLVEEIFSASGEFYQTPHKEICRYCPYNKICQRYYF